MQKFFGEGLPQDAYMQVGSFISSELMGALYKDEYWKYTQKTKKESQLFTTELPEDTLIYVFGSSIYSNEFNDVDLLFVIPDSVDKLFSYDCVQNFCRKLEANIGSVVDFTILTDLEEQKIRFVEQVKALLCKFPLWGSQESLHQLYSQTIRRRSPHIPLETSLYALMMEETMTILQTSSPHTSLTVRALTRRAALAGMIGPALFGFLILLLTLLEYDFMRGLGWHPIRESDVPWPSGLALGPYGWLQVANFVLFGFLLITFAIGLHRELRGRKWALVGPALLIVAGIALILCGFKTDPHLANGPQTIHGWIHTVAFFLLLGSLIPSFFFFWRLLRKDPRWRRYDWYALISGVLALITFFLPQVGFYISLFVMLTWIEVMALRLWVLSGQSAP